MDTTMSATTTSTPTRRTALAALALALVAILLTGLAPNHAGATPRSTMVKRANEAIERCFDSGGDAEVRNYSDGTIYVTCQYDDGTVSLCDTNKPADKGCTWYPPESAQRRPATSVNVSALPQAQSVSSGQSVPVAQAVAVRQGTHLALSGGRLILVADDRR